MNTYPRTTPTAPPAVQQAQAEADRLFAIWRSTFYAYNRFQCTAEQEYDAEQDYKQAQRAHQLARQAAGLPYVFTPEDLEAIRKEQKG